MTSAGIPQNLIRTYVNDAIAGKNVPHPTSFTAMAHQALKGRSNAKTPKVRDTTEAF